MGRAVTGAWRSWHLAAGLLLAVLAQACGSGSSTSSGPGGNRVALEFDQVRAARAGQLPAGCSRVVVEISPEGIVLQVTEAGQPLSVRLSAGPHTIKGTLFCGAQQFVATASFTVPPGLQSVEVALVFGDVQVQLTVQAGPGVSVTGPGISCPSDCTQTYINGTSVPLSASPAGAAFSGGCSGQGGCTVNMNADKTVAATLGAPSGFIRVDNTGGVESFDLRITIDGSTVVANLGSNDAPVTTEVSATSHTVRAFCETQFEFEHPDSPRTVNVDAGQTAVVAFDGDTCFNSF